MSDLNNDSVSRQVVNSIPDPAYSYRSFAITSPEDDPEVRKAYRPFILDPKVTENDWIAKLELSTTLKLVEQNLSESDHDRLKVLVLYGSLRQRFVMSF
jgi:arsenic resistance protein ArsH